MRGTSLKILGLVSSDAGIYQCIATNTAGSVQAAAQLQVRTKGNYPGTVFCYAKMIIRLIY